MCTYRLLLSTPLPAPILISYSLRWFLYSASPSSVVATLPFSCFVLSKLLGSQPPSPPPPPRPCTRQRAPGWASPHVWASAATLSTVCLCLRMCVYVCVCVCVCVCVILLAPLILQSLLTLQKTLMLRGIKTIDYSI
jgi:hypothetical protein